MNYLYILILVLVVSFSFARVSGKHSSASSSFSFAKDRAHVIEPAQGEDDSTKWIELNEKYSNLWPNITKKRPDDVPQDEAKWREVNDKLKYLSEKPGKGD